MTGKWPKHVPPLTEEQQRISDDFMEHWHDVLPKRFPSASNFGHDYVVRTAPPAFARTLEVGAGLGEHLDFESLTPEQEAAYVALDIRANMVERLRHQYPRVQTMHGDCQRRLDYPDGHFDRILAIHVLEHLPDLPSAVREIHRLCHREDGILQVVLPCEGSPAYLLAREISAKRVFKRRYGGSYDWFIEREHLSVPSEIIEELSEYFEITDRSYFPLRIPVVFCNLVIAMTLRPR